MRTKLKKKAQQSFKILPAMILLIVVIGMLTGVGVLLLDKFGTAVKTTENIFTENVTLTAGAGNFANDELVTFSECFDDRNSSILTTAQCNSTNLPAGEVTVTTVLAIDAILVNYTYKADSFTTTNLGFARDAVADIAEDWLALIVTILVLALILGLVVGGFAANKVR